MPQTASEEFAWHVAPTSFPVPRGPLHLRCRAWAARAALRALRIEAGDAAFFVPKSKAHAACAPPPTVPPPPPLAAAHFPDVSPMTTASGGPSDPPSFRLTRSDFTFAATVRIADEAPVNAGPVLAQRSPGGAGPGFVLQIAQDYAVLSLTGVPGYSTGPDYRPLCSRRIPRGGVWGAALTSAKPLGRGVWHRLSLVRKGAGLALFVDGLLSCSAQSAGDWVPGAAPLVLGADAAAAGPASWFQGDIRMAAAWAEAFLPAGAAWYTPPRYYLGTPGAQCPAGLHIRDAETCRAAHAYLGLDPSLIAWGGADTQSAQRCASRPDLTFDGQQDTRVVPICGSIPVGTPPASVSSTAPWGEL